MFWLKIFSICVLFSLSMGDRCNSCGKECDKCTYGSTYSKTCQFNVCYKAPGEACGYVDVEDYLCAEGLYCKNDKCQGCALTPFKCFTELKRRKKNNPYDNLLRK